MKHELSLVQKFKVKKMNNRNRYFSAKLLHCLILQGETKELQRKANRCMNFSCTPGVRKMKHELISKKKQL
jgi:hypothetical protein